MNTLFTAFIIQAVLCAVLFISILYLVVKNASLKEEIEREQEKVKTGPGEG